MAKTATKRKPKIGKDKIIVEDEVKNEVSERAQFIADCVEEVKDLPTKSAKIRALSAKGLKVGEIAKGLGIIYQHARNVLITPLKRGPRK